MSAPEQGREIELERMAWKIYCREKAGEVGAAGKWDDVPATVQWIYLSKAITAYQSVNNLHRP